MFVSTVKMGEEVVRKKNEICEYRLAGKNKSEID